MKAKEKIGGRGRDRTGDPLLAKQVLSQLSYTPTDSAISLMDFLWRRPVAFSAGALARRSYIRLGASPCFDLRMN
jgi:hypothetical protein